MVPAERIRQKLVERRFENVVIWSHGVDTDLFARQPRFDKVGALDEDLGKACRAVLAIDDAIRVLPRAADA
jgi:hypothetical protein